MADEEDLLGAMDDLGEEGEGEEEEGGGSPLMKYLPIVGVVLVIQIIIGYVIASMFFGPAEEATAEETEEPDPTEMVQVKVEDEVIWEALDPIVVNPAGTSGLRFASVHVHLGLTSQAVFDAIEQKNLMSRIKDVLIQVLSEKTIDQLDPAHHAELKKEMKERLNDWLSPDRKPPAVKNVYFQGFVLQ